MKRLLLGLTTAVLLYGGACAQVAISQLPAASALAGTEVTPVVQAVQTRKATIDQIGTRTSTVLKAATNTWTSTQTFSAASMQAPVLIQLGGTTTSFPALKRASAALQARLADDSNYADIYAANYIASGGAYFSGVGSLTGPADGVFLFRNTAMTDFSRLQFGGTTASFPSIKRSATGLLIRLADDSADAPLQASIVTASSTITTPNIKTTPVAVASLPTCNAGADGLLAFVTDANATTFASSLAAGGSNHIPVYCDGSGTPAWKIG